MISEVWLDPVMIYKRVLCWKLCWNPFWVKLSGLHGAAAFRLLESWLQAAEPELTSLPASPPAAYLLLPVDYLPLVLVPLSTAAGSNCRRPPWPTWWPSSPMWAPTCPSSRRSRCTRPFLRAWWAERFSHELKDVGHSWFFAPRFQCWATASPPSCFLLLWVSS